jgi:hypothetical protein
VAITRLTGADTSTLTWETIGAASGDLILLFFINDGGDNQTTPGTLTRLGVDSGTSVEGGAYYRICTGAEAGTLIASEASFGVSNEEYCWHLIKIPTGEWHGTTPPEAADVRAASGTINPPNLAPSWGSETDNIWVVAACRDDDDGISALTADYTTNFAYTESAASNASCEIASSWRLNTAASEDPGNATQTNTNEEYIAWTVGVRPVAVGGVEQEIVVQPTATSTLTRTLTAYRTLGVQPTATATVSRVYTGTRTLIVQPTATPAVSRLATFARAFVVSPTATPSMAASRLFLEKLAVTVTNAIDLALLKTYQQVLGVTSTAALSLRKAVTKTLAVAMTAGVAVRRAMSQTLTVAASMTLNMVDSAAFSRTLPTVATFARYLLGEVVEAASPEEQSPVDPHLVRPHDVRAPATRAMGASTERKHRRRGWT